MTVQAYRLHPESHKFWMGVLVRYTHLSVTLLTFAVKYVVLNCKSNKQIQSVN